MVVILMGCSDGLISVKGKVTYDGNPVVDGTISFTTKNGAGSSYEARILNDNGTYRLRCVPGTMLVRISGFRMEKSDTPSSSIPVAPPVFQEFRKDYIPYHYNTASKLTVNISPSGGTHDFVLEPIP